MTSKTKSQPLEMVRNIVDKMDLEINCVNGTIDYLQNQPQSEINDKLLLEYNEWLKTLKDLRNFVIYKA
jgi:hypothetical protein